MLLCMYVQVGLCQNEYDIVDDEVAGDGIFARKYILFHFVVFTNCLQVYLPSLQLVTAVHYEQLWTVVAMDEQILVFLEG